MKTLENEYLWHSEGMFNAIVLIERQDTFLVSSFFLFKRNIWRTKV